MRFRSSLSLLLTVSAIAAVPLPSAAAAPREPSPAAIVFVPRDAPVMSLATRPAAESLHVYLLAQLIVPDSITRDSIALIAFIRHAVTVQVAAFAAADVGLYRGTAFTRSSDLPGSNTSSVPDALTRPPNRSRAETRPVALTFDGTPCARSRRFTIASFVRS